MSRATVPWKRFLRLAAIPVSVLLVCRQIRRWRCSVVYSNTLSVCEGAVAAWLLRRPHVWSIHEFQYEDHDLQFHLGQALSLRLVARLSSLCIACSEAVARRYGSILPPDRLKVIYPCVAPPEPRLSSPSKQLPRTDRIRLVVVGTLVRGKRQGDAVRALGELVHIGLDAELVLVGGGDADYKRSLEELVRREQLDGRVFFTGCLDDPAAVMNTATLVLVCSQSEAFPRVPIEAMLLGKAVIGTRCGGTMEQIHHGVTGWLYEPGDVRELVRLIRSALEDPERLRQVGSAAHAWASERFHEERYVTAILTKLQPLAEPMGPMTVKHGRA
jgi:glycosyltransferase involved in cell wall biosynthesis